MSEQREVTDKVNQLNSHLASNFKAARELAEAINGKVPAEKKIPIKEISEDDSIQENSSKLVDFIQNIKEFVQEIDECLEGILSPEDYAKVANVTSTTEQVLDIIKSVTKGLVPLVGPWIATIARKLMSNNSLEKLEQNVGKVKDSNVVKALHESRANNVSRADIQELDDAIQTLKPDEKEDFASTVNQIIMFSKWQDKTLND